MAPSRDDPAFRYTAVAALALFVAGCALESEVRQPSLTDGEYRQVMGAIVQKQRERGDEPGPATFDRPAERDAFFIEQRLAPGASEYPRRALQRELASIRARQDALAAAAVGSPVGGLNDWSELGPGNIGGRTRALVIDPEDPDRMFAGGVAGGIWRTTNAGATWEVVDDMLPNLAIASMAIDPVDSSIMYAGTGEGFGSGPMAAGIGIFKSTDSGETWLLLPATETPAFTYVNKLAISPNDSSRIYAATRFGVYRSLDAGASWSVVLSNPAYIATPPTSTGCLVGCTDLKIRADRDPDALWAAFGSFERDGLYRSDDGGNTWLAYTTSLNQGRMTIALAPSNNDVVYVLMADNGSGGPTGRLVNVYRATDGANFEARVDFETLTGPWLLSNLILATGCLEGGTYSQGWYDNIIKVDPIDPETVWVGGIDLFRSDDGGRSFGIAAYWIFYTFFPPPPYQLHPDHHEIVFHPEYDGQANQTMYVTNDGGIFRTANARAATSVEDCPLPGEEPYPEIIWERLNNGYGVTQFYHGDSARTAYRFAGGAQDNGTLMVQSVETPNDWDLIFGGDGGYVAIDPTDHQTMFIEYQFFPNIWKSTDGGESFTQSIDGITDTDGLFITPYAMDQSDPQILWTGGSRPWRTMDGAETWQLVGPNFAGAAKISAIAIAPSDSNVVYLGFTNGYVAMTTNAIDPVPTWTVRLPGVAGAWVSSMAVDPDTPTTAYLTYSNFGVPHVWRTVNGGLDWASIDGSDADVIPNLPVHWIAIRPCNVDQLYVGTELGMFASDDGGLSWQPANVGFPNTIVESLDFRSNNELVAFTHGRGAFLARLRTCASCPGDVDGDDAVTFTDLLRVLAAWGPCGGCIEDITGDGTVGFADLLEVLAGWGGCL